jgi:hypothetical protein
MRLTLRTLLAYLDDVLEPAQTKLIGEKIQESAVAGKLVSLIRLVVRQRRLKAPSVSGPNVGIDPNLVAQYIDNTLTPEQVVEVERVLLTSDELLAEVASCHQVLAMVMGKQSEVSEASRERLYALGPVAQSDQLRVEEPVTSSEASVASAANREADRLAETPASTKAAPTEIPEYLRRSSWSQRVVPAAVVVLLVAVCLGLLIADPGFLTGIQELTKSKRDDGKPAAASGESTVASSQEGSKMDPKTGEAGNQTLIASTESKGGSVDVPSPSPAIPSGLDPTPLPDEPEPTTKPDKKSMPPETPADAAVAANRTPPSAVTPPANTAPAIVPAPAPAVGPKDPAPVLNAAQVQYVSNDGVVLRLDEMQRHWFLLPKRSVVAPGEALAILDPFEAVLDIDRGAILATVMGDSAIRLMPPDRTTSTGLDIRRGRVYLRSSRRDAAQNPQLAIAIGGDQWRLEFLTADTICTIEVAAREPFQFEKPFGQSWYVGVLRVLSGSVKWTPADGPAQQVGTETALDIVPPQQGQPGPAPVSSAFAPDWTDPQKRKQAPLRRFASLFERNFEPDQPVEMTLLALIKDSNAKIVELAVRALSLTESYTGMVQALAECSFEEGRFAARDGIRAWLPRDAERGAVLKELLEQRYPIADARAVYIMLWGFRPEDAMNKVTSLEIVNWLHSSHLEIRELAYYWIVHLTGRKWEFRASEVVARRESAVRKIEAHIMSAGALVKPVENPAPK